MRRIAVGLVSLWLVGCATTRNGKFPGRDELTKLTASSRPARLADSRTVEVDRWDMNGPLPEAIDSVPHHDDTPWQGLLEQAAARRSGLLMVSESMHCVAHQLGSFYLLHGGSPSRSLQNFIQARCGAAAGWSSANWVHGEAPAELGDAELFAQWKGNVEKMISSSSGGGASMAGIWFGRKDGKAVAMLAQARRDALVDRVALRPAEGGKVVISGELTNPAESIDASVTRGRFGFEVCQRDASVPLPRFSLTCPTSAEDPSAWIEVAAFPAGRVLGDVVLRMLALPSGAANKAWVRPDYGLHSESGAATAAELTRLVNQVRADAGQQPLALAEAESATAAKLAPYYFAAGNGDVSAAVGDKVVLGLEAGWDIHGTVRHSWFASASMLGGLDPASLLTAALEMPSGREALLRADARQLAVGPVKEEGEHPFLGCVFASYSLFEDKDRATELSSVQQKYQAARVAHKVSMPAGAPSLRQVMEGPTGAVQKGTMTPKQAMNAMAQEAASRIPGVQIRVWEHEVSSLDNLKFEGELATMPATQLEISIAHRHSEDEAWGTYVIFFLALVPTSA